MSVDPYDIIAGSQLPAVTRDRVLTPVSYTHLTLPTICSV